LGLVQAAAGMITLKAKLFMSEANTPVFQIQRVYMKEASLEQPNSPAILLEQQQPAVDIQLGVEANQAAEGVN